MSPRVEPHGVYIFDNFRLEAGELMLYRGGKEVAMPPKAVETLIALVERNGEIVRKDALMETIWSDAIVEESNLSRYIHMLRSTLGNQPDGTPYIETFRRRGYRFRGDVSKTYGGQLRGAAPAAIGGRDLRESSSRAGRVVALAEWTRPSPERPIPEHAVDGVPVEIPRRPAGWWKGRLLTVPLLLVMITAGASLGGYLWFRSSTPPLTDKDVILVADFENRTGEEVFDTTLKQGLAIQLQQSPFLSLLPDDRVRETLKLMLLPADTRITREIAREICLRQGVKAYLVGSITPLGTRYAIAVETVNAASGETFASEMIESADKEEILKVLTKLSLRLREKLGESLVSIERLATPLEATTSSLDALRLYTQARLAVQDADYKEAAKLLEHATKLDPDFALAFVDLGYAYYYTGRREIINPAIIRAYDLRDKVSQRERLSIIDAYHSFITAQIEMRVETLELQRELYPRESTAYVRLCNVYLFLGNYESAIEACRGAIELGEKRSYVNLLNALVQAGQFDQGAAVLHEAGDTVAEWREIRILAVSIAFMQGRFDEVERLIETLYQTGSRPLSLQLGANIAEYYGRVREADKLFQDAIKAAEVDAPKDRVAALYSDYARFKAVNGSCIDARSAVETGYSIENEPPLPGSFAWSLALCGEKTLATKVMNTLLQRFPKGALQTTSIAPTVAALLSLKSGDANGALDHLRTIPPGFESRSGFMIQTARGQAYLKLNRGAEAAAEFQKIVDHPGEGVFSPLYPLAYLGLARAHAQTGDSERAIQAYRKFLEIWRDADSDLPSLIEAKREYSRLAGP